MNAAHIILTAAIWLLLACGLIGFVCEVVNERRRAQARRSRPDLRHIPDHIAAMPALDAAAAVLAAELVPEVEAWLREGAR